MAYDRPVTTPHAGPSAYPFEQRVRFADSRLWDLQRSFYVNEGDHVWSDETVPHYITSNPMIADAYARAILAFLRDCRGAGQLPQGATVHVLELGSGTGRFGFYLLNRLRSLRESSAIGDVNVVVVMTEFADSALARLEAHPKLQPLIAEGALETARFDASAPSAVTLRRSGQTIGSDADEAPLVVVANYVLDSLPSQSYVVNDGVLHDNLLTVTTPRPIDDPTASTLMGDFDLSWDAVTMTERHPDAAIASILEEYASVLDDTALVMPEAAIACIRQLCTQAGPVFFLFGDKGYPHEANLLGHAEPNIMVHGGCFSLMVNFDALARYTRAEGGFVLHPDHLPARLVVAGYVFGTGRIEELRRTFTDHLAEGGPDDFFEVNSVVGHVVSDMNLPQMLAYLRWSRYDANVFLECFPALLDGAGDVPDVLRPDVHRVLRKVWEGYFPIGEREDISLCIGLVVSGLGYPREALEYFDHSVDRNEAFALGPEALAHVRELRSTVAAQFKQ